MLLAGDVGGTTTRLGFFERGERPKLVEVRDYATHGASRFIDVLSTFLGDVGIGTPIEAAAIGVAGPVLGDRARLTNGAWELSAGEIATRIATTRVALINDLQALANAVPVLRADELVTLQAGTPVLDGNAVVIAAGTGLGEALLHRTGGRFVVVPSEGGHADFAARTDRELDLVRQLREQHGRVEVEQVISGPGLVNLHRFTHGGDACAEVDPLDVSRMPAAIAASGLARRCPRCADALSMFVEAYGAEAGNLALRGVATGGVFIGGGIAPKILPALTDGRFIAALLAKAPMTTLLASLPVRVILNDGAGLLGAAVEAEGRTGGH